MFPEISVAMLLRRFVSALFVSVLFCTASFGEDPLVAESLEAIQKAVAFFHDRVADEGGYVYQVSDDLKLREGGGHCGPRNGLGTATRYSRGWHGDAGRLPPDGRTSLA